MFFNKKIYFFLSWIAFLSCKANRSTVSTVSHVRLGGVESNSCFSDFRYHQRLYQELEYLSTELMDSCFSHKSKAFSGTKNLGKSIWEGQLEGQKINQKNIFKIEHKDTDVFEDWQLYAESELGGRTIDFQTQDIYSFIPPVLTTGGALQLLKIGDAVEFEQRELSEATVEIANYNKKWKNSIAETFSPMCKSHIYSIKDRVEIIKQLIIDFENKGCCVDGGEKDQGAFNKEGPFLQCEKSAKKPIDNNFPFAPLNKSNKTGKYFEWPLCGGQLSCSSTSIVHGEISEFGGCTRCELRVGNEEAYNLKLASKTKTTCVTASAARGAVATALINHCMIRSPDSPFCNVSGENVNYDMPINKLYEYVTPQLHCEKVSFEGKEREDWVPLGQGGRGSSGETKTISYAGSRSLGRETGVSLKGSLGVLVGFNDHSMAKETAGETVYSVTQNSDRLPFFVEREGRVEFAEGVIGSCEGSVSTSACAQTSKGVEVGVDTYLFSGGSFINSSEANCNATSISKSWDSSIKTEVSGMTLVQLKEICDQQEANEMVDQIDVIYQAIQKADISKLDGKKFLSLDVKKKNIYCMNGSYEDEIEDDEFVKKGTQLSEIYLKGNKVDVIELHFQSKKTGYFDRKLDYHRVIKIEKDQGSILKPLGSSLVKTKELESLIKKVSLDSAGFFKGVANIGMGDLVCRSIPRPFEIDFERENGLACLYYSKKFNKAQIFKLNRLLISHVKGQLNVELKGDGELDGKAVSAEIGSLGKWGIMIKEGTINKIEIIELLKSLSQKWDEAVIAGCRSEKF